MANKAYLGTSIDGYIATRENGLEWLNEVPNPDKSDFGFGEFMDSIDAILMGRNTYETVISFGEWPYLKPVFVLSNSLNHVHQQIRGSVELIKGSPKQVVTILNRRGFHDLYVDGGIVVQSFITSGLLDEITITRIPIILGDGIPLFDSLESPIRLVHEETTIFQNYLVKSRYSIPN